jgi:predicted ATP-grasp superfamily ATP-dependent carboligase
MNMDANGLGVTRSLGRQGIPIMGMDFNPRNQGLHSKFVRPLICPDPIKDPDGVLEVMIGSGRELGDKGVVFACSDLFMLFLSRNRSELSHYFDFMIPSERIVEGMVNKRLQYDEAIRLGIPTPELYFPRTLEEVREVAKGLTYPAFIKPYYSHLWQLKFGNKGFIIRGEADMLRRFELISKTDLEWMVQSIVGVPGKDLFQACAYRGRNDLMSPVFTWEKTRQVPPNFGVGSFCTARHNPQVAELGTRFFKGLDYHGIGAVEFKLDPRDGTWRLIELNTRTWLQNIHAAHAGLNLSYLAYLDICQEPLVIGGDFRDNVRLWDAMGDLESFWTLRKRGDLSFYAWVRSWAGSECYANFAFDDIAPALKRVGYGFEVTKLLVYLMNRRTDQDDVSLGVRKR